MTLAAMGYPVMSLVLKILVVTCGLAAVLDLFDFDVGTVLAGLGIGGLAFALAAQDTLKNFFGSLMLIADRTKQRQLARNLANQLVVYATGAPISFADRQAVERILDRAGGDNPGLRRLVEEVIPSPIFQTK